MLFAPNWSAFAEYNFMGFGTPSTTFTGCGGTCVVSWSFSRICKRKELTFSISMLLAATSGQPAMHGFIILLYRSGERLGGMC